MACDGFSTALRVAVVCPAVVEIAGARAIHAAGVLDDAVITC